MFYLLFSGCFLHALSSEDKYGHFNSVSRTTIVSCSNSEEINNLVIRAKKSFHVADKHFSENNDLLCKVNNYNVYFSCWAVDKSSFNEGTFFQLKLTDEYGNSVFPKIFVSDSAQSLMQEASEKKIMFVEYIKEYICRYLLEGLIEFVNNLEKSSDGILSKTELCEILENKKEFFIEVLNDSMSDFFKTKWRLKDNESEKILQDLKGRSSNDCDKYVENVCDFFSKPISKSMYDSLYHKEKAFIDESWESSAKEECKEIVGILKEKINQKHEEIIRKKIKDLEKSENDNRLGIQLLAQKEALKFKFELDQIKNCYDVLVKKSQTEEEHLRDYNSWCLLFDEMAKRNTIINIYKEEMNDIITNYGNRTKDLIIRHSHVSQLCDDVIYEILSFITPESNVRCSEFICKRWKNISRMSLSAMRISEKYLENQGWMKSIESRYPRLEYIKFFNVSKLLPVSQVLKKIAPEKNPLKTFILEGTFKDDYLGNIVEILMKYKKSLNEISFNGKYGVAGYGNIKILLQECSELNTLCIKGDLFQYGAQDITDALAHNTRLNDTLKVLCVEGGDDSFFNKLLEQLPKLESLESFEMSISENDYNKIYNWRKFEEYSNLKKLIINSKGNKKIKNKEVKSFIQTMKAFDLNENLKIIIQGISINLQKKPSKTS